jgi:hypothetical protein
VSRGIVLGGDRNGWTAWQAAVLVPLVLPLVLPLVVPLVVPLLFELLLFVLLLHAAARATTAPSARTLLTVAFGLSIDGLLRACGERPTSRTWCQLPSIDGCRPKA